MFVGVARVQKKQNWRSNNWLYHQLESGIIMLDAYVGASLNVVFPSPRENFLINPSFFIRHDVTTIDFNGIEIAEAYNVNDTDIGIPKSVLEVKNLPPNLRTNTQIFCESNLSKIPTFGYSKYNSKGNYRYTFMRTDVRHATHLHPEPKRLVNTFAECALLVDGADLQKSVRVMYETFCRCNSLRKGIDTKFAYSLLSMDRVYKECKCLLETGTFSDNIRHLDKAFYDCLSLIKIEPLPQKLVSMVATFRGCKSLELLPTIPESVRYMDGAFMYCTNLKYPMSKLPNNVLTVENLFYGCSQLRKGVNIPNSVISTISMYEGCSWLQKGVKIGSSVTDTSNMYSMCISLREAYPIPDNVTSCEGMFNGCRLLKHPPKLSKNTKNMNYMFRECSSMLEYPEVPKTVTSMYGTFAGCINASGNLIINSPNVEKCESLISLGRLKDTTIYIPFEDDNGEVSKTYLAFMGEDMFNGNYDIRDLKQLHRVDTNNKT